MRRSRAFFNDGWWFCADSPHLIGHEPNVEFSRGCSAKIQYFLGRGEKITVSTSWVSQFSLCDHASHVPEVQQLNDRNAQNMTQIIAFLTSLRVELLERSTRWFVITAPQYERAPRDEVPAVFATRTETPRVFAKSNSILISHRMLQQ